MLSFTPVGPLFYSTLSLGWFWKAEPDPWSVLLWNNDSQLNLPIMNKRIFMAEYPAANRVIICRWKEPCSVNRTQSLCLIGYSKSWTRGCSTAESFRLRSWYKILGNYWSEKWEWPCSRAAPQRLFIYLLKEVTFSILGIMTWAFFFSFLFFSVIVLSCFVSSSFGILFYINLFSLLPPFFLPSFLWPSLYSPSFLPSVLWPSLYLYSSSFLPFFPFLFSFFFFCLFLYIYILPSFFASFLPSGKQCYEF